MTIQTRGVKKNLEKKAAVARKSAIRQLRQNRNIRHIRHIRREIWGNFPNNRRNSINFASRTLKKYENG